MIISKIEGVKPVKKTVVKTVKNPTNKFLIEGYFVAESWNTSNNKEIYIELPAIFF